MENRERDRVSQRATPTEAGQLNRSVEEEKGRRENSGTTAEFGQSIGRAEDLSEGGEMNRNRNQDEVSSNRGNMENESSRRSGMGNMGSSSGRRSGSLGSGNDVSSDRGSSSSGGRNSGSSGIGGSSEGRH